MFIDSNDLIYLSSQVQGELNGILKLKIDSGNRLIFLSAIGTPDHHCVFYEMLQSVSRSNSILAITYSEYTALNAPYWSIVTLYKSNIGAITTVYGGLENMYYFDTTIDVDNYELIVFPTTTILSSYIDIVLLKNQVISNIFGSYRITSTNSNSIIQRGIMIFPNGEILMPFAEVIWSSNTY